MGWASTDGWTEATVDDKAITWEKDDEITTIGRIDSRGMSNTIGRIGNSKISNIKSLFGKGRVFNSNI